MPSESHCSVSIEGTEEEVVPLAAYHAITVHEHADTPELRQEIRSVLQDVVE
jgi:hypothetical protein